MHNEKEQHTIINFNNQVKRRHFKRKVHVNTVSLNIIFVYIKILKQKYRFVGLWVFMFIICLFDYNYCYYSAEICCLFGVPSI